MSDAAASRTLVFLKPDAVQRGLIGEIISRFERRGMKIVGLKMQTVSREVAEEHYGHHSDKSFFPKLMEFITSGPIVAMVIETPNAAAVVRTTVGVTNPTKADPGTIRFDYAVDMGLNIIHASEDDDAVAIEINRFFSPDEVQTWERSVDKWIVE